MRAFAATAAGVSAALAVVAAAGAGAWSALAGATVSAVAARTSPSAAAVRRAGTEVISAASCRRRCGEPVVAPATRPTTRYLLRPRSPGTAPAGGVMTAPVVRATCRARPECGLRRGGTPPAQDCDIEAAACTSGMTRCPTCVARAITVDVRPTPSVETTWSITRCRSALDRATTRHSRSPLPVIVWTSSTSGISASRRADVVVAGLRDLERHERRDREAERARCRRPGPSR